MRHSTIDGFVKNLVQQSMHTILLHLARYAILSGHPKELQMYDTLRREYYSANMSMDVYEQSEIVKFAPKWLQSLSINVSYIYFHLVTYLLSLQLRCSAHYCEPSQPTDLWLLLLIGTVS